MNASKEKILSSIAANKPAPVPHPDAIFPEKQQTGELLETFSKLAVSIGSKVFPVDGIEAIDKILRKEFPEAKRVVSNIDALKGLGKNPTVPESEPHAYENVDLAILEGSLAVAENSAIWLPEEKMIHRVLPFICQHLVLIIREEDIVAHLHEAYEKGALTEEGYGVFIAGPSKTADIEQSLVLGAHGPRSLRVFVLRA